MQSVIVNLGPGAQEELYADINEDFLAFVILEALFNVVRHIPASVRQYTSVLNLAEEYIEDPETELFVSAEFLAHIMREMDAKTGVDTESEEYNKNFDELMSAVKAKLAQAADAISNNNDLVMLMAINDVLSKPELSIKLNFSTTHLGDKVMFMFSGEPILL